MCVSSVACHSPACCCYFRLPPLSLLRTAHTHGPCSCQFLVTLWGFAPTVDVLNCLAVGCLSGALFNWTTSHTISGVGL